MRRKNKKTILIVGIILTILLVISAYNNNFQGVKDTITNVFSSIQEISQQQKYSICPENILPEKITFEVYDDKSEMFNRRTIGGWKEGLYIRERGSTIWKDGVPVLVYSYSEDYNITTGEFFDKENVNIYKSSGADEPICVKGFKEGQNLNYYYCEDLAYLHKTQPILESGEIGKEISIEYKIDIVLKELNRKNIYSRESTIIEPQGSSFFYTNAEFEIIEARCLRKK
jgi:hypothetical protein